MKRFPLHQQQLTGESHGEEMLPPSLATEALDASPPARTVYGWFADPSVEASFVEYCQAGGPIPVGVAMAGVGVLFAALDSLASPKWREVVNIPQMMQDLYAVIAIGCISLACCAAVCVAYATGKLRQPRRTEHLWLLLSFLFVTGSAVVKAYRLLLYIPADRLRHFDHMGVTMPMSLVLGTQRFVYAAGMLLYGFIMSLVVVWARWGVPPEGGDVLIGVFCVMVGVLLFLDERAMRERYLEHRKTIIQAQNTLRARVEVNNVLSKRLSMNLILAAIASMDAPAARSVAGNRPPHAVIAHSIIATVVVVWLRAATPTATAATAAMRRSMSGGIHVAAALDALLWRRVQLTRLQERVVELARLMDEAAEALGGTRLLGAAHELVYGFGIPAVLQLGAPRACAFAAQALDIARKCSRKHAAELTDASAPCVVETRVGVHSGVVHGAVIPQQQLVYQVFGPTVDGARRLSRVTHELLPPPKALISPAVAAAAHMVDLQPGPELVLGESFQRCAVLTACRFQPIGHIGLDTELPSLRPPPTLPGDDGFLLVATESITPPPGDLAQRQLPHGRASSRSSRHSRSTTEGQKVLQAKKRSLIRTLAWKSSSGIGAPKAAIAAEVQGQGDPRVDDSPADSIESEAPRPEVDLVVLRRELSAQRYEGSFLRHLILEFKQPRVEREFRLEMRQRFAAASRWSWGLAATLATTMTLFVAIESAQASKLPATVAIALCLMLAVAVGAVIIAATRLNERVSPAAGVGLFMGALVVMQTTVYVLAGQSQLSIPGQQSYVVTIFAAIVTLSGTPGVGFLSYVVGNSVVFLTVLILPMLWPGPFNDIAVLNFSFGYVLVFSVGFRSHETWERQRFLNESFAEVAWAEALEERTNLMLILSRTVPREVVPLVLAWMPTRRAGGAAWWLPHPIALLRLRWPTAEIVALLLQTNRASDGATTHNDANACPSNGTTCVTAATALALSYSKIMSVVCRVVNDYTRARFDVCCLEWSGEGVTIAVNVVSQYVACTKLPKDEDDEVRLHTSQSPLSSGFQRRLLKVSAAQDNDVYFSTASDATVPVAPNAATATTTPACQGAPDGESAEAAPGGEEVPTLVPNAPAGYETGGVAPPPPQPPSVRPPPSAGPAPPSSSLAPLREDIFVLAMLATDVWQKLDEEFTTNTGHQSTQSVIVSATTRHNSSNGVSVEESLTHAIVKMTPALFTAAIGVGTAAAGIVGDGFDFTVIGPARNDVDRTAAYGNFFSRAAFVQQSNTDSAAAAQNAVPRPSCLVHLSAAAAGRVASRRVEEAQRAAEEQQRLNDSNLLGVDPSASSRSLNAIAQWAVEEERIGPPAGTLNAATACLWRTSVTVEAKDDLTSLSCENLSEERFTNGANGSGGTERVWSGIGLCL